jgi:hypothetical protein
VNSGRDEKCCRDLSNWTYLTGCRDDHYPNEGDENDIGNRDRASEIASSFFSFFEMVSNYVAHAGLELVK